jgi:hypothetical protein
MKKLLAAVILCSLVAMFALAIADQPFRNTDSLGTIRSKLAASTVTTNRLAWLKYAEYGTAILSTGGVVVASSYVTNTHSMILLSKATGSRSITNGILWTGNITNGVSFTIFSTEAADTNRVSYLVLPAEWAPIP